MLQCAFCECFGLALVPAYSALKRVTSDCKPWPAGGTLAVCSECSGVQAVTDAGWHAEAKRIYDEYSIYYQSDGVEQMVFDASGVGTERSSRVLTQVAALGLLPPRARALDIGSGSGVLLHALARMRPEWTLSASDLSDRYQARLATINGFEQLYTCPPDEIPGTFDLISMVHVLEHIPTPLPMLRALRAKLGPTGVLLIQTPDMTRNPFDLVVADHSSHFSAASMSVLVKRAGYQIIALSTDWVTKELSMLARPAADIEPVSTTTRAAALKSATARVGWLESVASQAHGLSSRQPFGVFGTSIAAAWAYGELEGRIDFFVDEDPARVGRPFMGEPVVRPADVPKNSDVYICLAPEVAHHIYDRLTELDVQFQLHVPPAFTDMLEPALT